MSRIMDIAPYALTPATTGGQKGILGFVEALAHKHTLTLVSQQRSIPIEGVHNALVLCHTACRYINPSYYFKLKKLAKQQGIEHIIIEHPYYAWLGYLLSKSLGIPWHIHTHNIEYQRFRNLGKWWWRPLMWYERWALRHADTVFFKTRQDMALAIKSFGISGHKCRIVPYGVPIASQPADKEQCQAQVRLRHHIEPDTSLLFFFGVMSYQPNADAVLLFVKHIAPLLHKAGFTYKLLVCGKGMKPDLRQLLAQQRHIEYLGFVDNIEEYTKAADVVINPVLGGGGIKTKIVEAIAMGTNVVSTRTGSAGLDEAVCASKLRVLDDQNWEGFALAIMHAVISNQPTPASFYQHFYWGNIVDNLADVLGEPQDARR